MPDDAAQKVTTLPCGCVVTERTGYKHVKLCKTHAAETFKKPVDNSDLL